MFTKNNKVFFLDKLNKPLKKLDNLVLPKPKKYHVLVKILFSGLCGSQIMEINGKRGKDIYLPHLLGHEGYAKVIKVGEKVKKLKQNDFVLLTWIKGNGGQESNIQIENGKRFINSGPINTFSNYALVSENRCIKVKHINNKTISPILGCSLPTGVGIIKKNLKPKKNKSFIVSGLGGVGIFVLLALLNLNTKKIIVIEKNEKKLNYLKKLKLGIELIKFNKNIKKNVLKKNINELADYIIDCTGNIVSMNNCLNLIKKNGTFIFASHPNSKYKLKIDPHELISGKKIFGSWGGGINLEKDKKFLINTFNNQFLKSPLKKLIKIYSLNNLNSAINDFKNGKVFKVILKH